MANKVGPLIKEARTNAGLTQEQLAKKVKVVSASDIGKAERGEKELTQAALKEIAKATGVTQKSLIDAAKASTYKTSSSSSSKKTSSSSSKKTSSSSSKKTSSSTAKKSSMQVTATEKKLVELYREADSDTKKRVTNILKGKEEDVTDVLSGLLGGKGDVGDALGSILENLGKK